MSPRIATYHEDDYCRIELLPAQNWTHCAHKLGRLDEFAEAFEGPDDGGWTEICVRSHAPLPISALGIDSAGVSNILALHLPQFDTVQTNDGPAFEKCTNTAAFGYPDGCIIFVSHNGSGHVEAIWLTIGQLPPQQETDFLASLHALDALGPLLLVDWGWSTLLRLRDIAKIHDYLRIVSSEAEA